MGLPGAGKTTLAKALAKKLGAVHFNADDVRKLYNDWDFSIEGRLRQATRLGKLCDDTEAEYVIADFVCPTNDTRRAFGDAFIIWVDRIDEGRYADTNKLFESPINADITINNEITIEKSMDLILKKIKQD